MPEGGFSSKLRGTTVIGSADPKKTPTARNGRGRSFPDWGRPNQASKGGAPISLVQYANRYRENKNPG
jgi:hypothetical protein